MNIPKYKLLDVVDGYGICVNPADTTFLVGRIRFMYSYGSATIQCEGESVMDTEIPEIGYSIARNKTIDYFFNLIYPSLKASKIYIPSADEYSHCYLNTVKTMFAQVPDYKDISCCLDEMFSSFGVSRDYEVICNDMLYDMTLHEKTSFINTCRISEVKSNYDNRREYTNAYLFRKYNKADLAKMMDVETEYWTDYWG